MKKALITTVASLLTWGSIAVIPAFAFDTGKMPLRGSDATYHHVGYRWSPGRHGWYPGHGSGWHGGYGPGRYPGHGYGPYHRGYRR
jgi:hypothetical protein